MEDKCRGIKEMGGLKAQVMRGVKVVGEGHMDLKGATALLNSTGFFYC